MVEASDLRLIRSVQFGPSSSLRPGRRVRCGCPGVRQKRAAQAQDPCSIEASDSCSLPGGAIAGEVAGPITGRRGGRAVQWWHHSSATSSV